MFNIKKLVRKMKRYDLDEMETLQRTSRNLRDYVKKWIYYANCDNFEDMTIYAKLAIASMIYIQENYPLETYIAVYSIYESELMEMKEFLMKEN